MAIYEGIPHRVGRGGIKVLKDSVPLDPERSQKVYNHSPDGFAWGYGGSGPSQLALALLLEETDEQTALAHYQDFKWHIVARWPMTSPWKITSEDIQNWLKGVTRNATVPT